MTFGEFFKAIGDDELCKHCNLYGDECDGNVHCYGGSFEFPPCTDIDDDDIIDEDSIFDIDGINSTVSIFDTDGINSTDTFLNTEGVKENV